MRFASCGENYSHILPMLALSAFSLTNIFFSLCVVWCGGQNVYFVAPAVCNSVNHCNNTIFEYDLLTLAFAHARPVFIRQTSERM